MPLINIYPGDDGDSSIFGSIFGVYEDDFEEPQNEEPKCTKTYNCEVSTSFCWGGRCRDTTESSVCIEYKGQATDDGWKWENDDLYEDIFFKCETAGPSLFPSPRPNT